MEIVDTVYLVAYLRPSDPLHHEAARVVENLGRERRVSQAALIELDLLMKARGFTVSEKLRTWLLLEKIIPEEAVEALQPLDFAAATVLTEGHDLDYFDALVAAQCIIRGARPLTTDKGILEVASTTSRSELLEEAGELAGRSRDRAPAWSP